MNMMISSLPGKPWEKNAMENRFFLTKWLVIVLLVLLSLPAKSDTLSIEKVLLEDATELKSLPTEELNYIKTLPHYLTGFHMEEPMNRINIKGIDVLFSNKGKGILIVREKKPLVEIVENRIRLFADTPTAPLSDSLAVVYDQSIHAISYYSAGKEPMRFFDLGLDGVDVIYKAEKTDIPYIEFEHPFRTFKDGEECQKHPEWWTASCCKDKTGKLEGFVFSDSSGWGKAKTVPAFNQEKLDEYCQSISDNAGNLLNSGTETRQ